MAGPKPVWVRRVEDTRATVARFFNASPLEIAFTKNTSEGLNIAANAVPLVAGESALWSAATARRDEPVPMHRSGTFPS
ncbi:aminotransferase class V-fold PLP-dependent enzyme [Caballeronia sp. LZ028]|nr:aminotransferase class V-fold PLP-dependent enzyme [Caballeronia sp. ATUFL_F2_KS42]MDR5765888.1 aminotransferase class V-fold PLP-dependent enzyme [Caballeronia sp. LZ028]